VASTVPEGDYIVNRPLRGPLNPTPVDHATDTCDTIDWLVKNVLICRISNALNRNAPNRAQMPIHSVASAETSTATSTIAPRGNPSPPRPLVIRRATSWTAA
jgi:hypothetical protein